MWDVIKNDELFDGISRSFYVESCESNELYDIFFVGIFVIGRRNELNIYIFYVFKDFTDKQWYNYKFGPHIYF